MFDSGTLSVYATVVLAYIAKFFTDVRVIAIIGLILLDVVLAVAVAIRTKKFEGRRLAEFLRTMVVPYVIGYLALYLFSKLMAWSAQQSNADASVWLGQAAAFISESVIMLAWLALMGNLAFDVVKQLKALRYPFADGLDVTPGIPVEEDPAGGSAQDVVKGVSTYATKPPGRDDA